MIVEDDAKGTSSITYGDLARRTSRFAQLLRDLGVDAGDRVLVRLPNSIDYPTAFFGTMKRGAIAVPTSTLLTAEEVRYLVQDSGARAIVIDAAAWESMRAALDGAGSLAHVIVAGEPLDRALAGIAALVRLRHGVGRSHRALGKVQLDVRAGIRAHGSAVSRQDRDRPRRQERCGDVAPADR
jgi:acyl-CoA synthetase (AMP-forming)/AMP-acid ligase II